MLPFDLLVGALFKRFVRAAPLSRVRAYDDHVEVSAVDVADLNTGNAVVCAGSGIVYTGTDIIGGGILIYLPS